MALNLSPADLPSLTVEELSILEAIVRERSKSKTG